MAEHSRIHIIADVTADGRATIDKIVGNMAGEIRTLVHDMGCDTVPDVHITEDPPAPKQLDKTRWDLTDPTTASRFADEVHETLSLHYEPVDETYHGIVSETSVDITIHSGRLGHWKVTVELQPHNGPTGSVWLQTHDDQQHILELFTQPQMAAAQILQQWQKFASSS